jgi:hypothetical protein
MTNYVTKKSYGAMVKDLNLQSEGEGFKSSQLQPKIIEVFCLRRLCNLFFEFFVSLRWLLG